MFEYGQLIYSDASGWVLLKDKIKSEELSVESVVSALNHLAKDGWEVVLYEDKLGYILKRETKKRK